MSQNFVIFSLIELSGSAKEMHFEMHFEMLLSEIA